MTTAPSTTGTPQRTVHHGDGIAFLREASLGDARLPADHAIITSLPDTSELPALSFDAWKQWFIETVALACSTVDDTSLALFYQTDIKREGRWVDKGHLVMLGIDAAHSHTLFHKIVCRVPAGNTTFGRPAYAHLIAASRTRLLDPGSSTPDVLPALGTMSWSRAMGTAACEAAIRFVASQGARTIVDPFCGQGSILAAANAHGLDAIGVELSRRRVEASRKATHAVE